MQQPDNLLVEVLHFEIEHPLTGQRLKRTLLRAHDTRPSEGREPVLNWVGIMRASVSNYGHALDDELATFRRTLVERLLA